MSRLKVALVVSGFPSEDQPESGLFNQVAAGQLAQVVDLTVVHLRFWKPGRSFIRVSQEGPYRLIVVSSPALPTNNLKFFCPGIKLYNWVAQRTLAGHLRGLDLIHSVGMSFSGVLGGIWARRFGAKHVVQLIGSDINSEAPKLKGLACLRNWVDSIDGVGCNSSELKTRFEQIFGTIPNLKVIYRGVDLDKYQPQYYSSTSGKPVFLFLGGLNLYPSLDHGINTKGGVTLLKAWLEHESELNQLGAELWYGGPEVDNRSRLGLESEVSSIKWIGAQSRESIPDLYSQATCVLIPSLEEGMPNVAVEAAAAGRMIIASKVGGLPEVIVSEESGILVDPGDVKSLGETLIRVARDPEKALKSGKRAREIAVEKFNSNNFSRLYHELYGRIVDG